MEKGLERAQGVMVGWSGRDVQFSIQLCKNGEFGFEQRVGYV